MCEECCAAAEPCEFIAWGRSCQRCQFHVYGTCTFRDQTYFDTFRFSTNRQGDGFSSLNQTSAPPLGHDLFAYDQLAGHFDAAFKRNQALHDLRLSQIKASLARITDLNVLKEHLLICERGNWADEVTTMIIERQIEIMHPAPQRRQGPHSLNSPLFSRLSPATIASKGGVPVHSICGAGLVATARKDSYPTVLSAGTTTGLCSTTPQSLTAFAPGLFSQARRDGHSLFLFSQLLPLILPLMERIWEHYHKENCSLVKRLINSGTTPGELSALQSLFISKDYSPSARFWLSQLHKASPEIMAEFSIIRLNLATTALRVALSALLPVWEAAASNVLSNLVRPASTQAFLGSSLPIARSFQPSLPLLPTNPTSPMQVKWDKWNQLMPYVQEIVSKQVYEEFASFAQAYHHVLSKLSVNILQDIRIIVVANTTLLSLLRTVIDGAIIAAKARKSKAREARIISSRLPQGVTIPTQDVVDRFRANLGAAGHRVLENASVHSVIVGLDNIAKMLKNSEAPHSLWVGSAANLATIGVPVDAPRPSDQSIAATRDFLMKPSEAVGKALSPSSSTDSLPDLVPVSSPGSPTSTTYEMLYQDLTSDSNNLSRRY
ncbi:hypothetical protein B0H14DRAFT_2628530 [Mycena olivaceomarginata]|nr:hypothetical protein B0H14DRAFT_2628530 [Mycena olivaceomarginata]